MKLSRTAVVATVFGAAAAVLTLEILTVRLLAPHVGLTIETYTAIIGVALGGIAVGAAVGGRLADHVDPVAADRRAARAAAGVLAMLSVPIVAAARRRRRGRGGRRARARGCSASARRRRCSAASRRRPRSSRSRDLGRTGSEVGRLSAWATAGALDRDLRDRLRPRAAALHPRERAGRRRACVLAGVAHHRAAAARSRASRRCARGALGVAAGSACDVDSAYYCAKVAGRPRPAVRPRARARRPAPLLRRPATTRATSSSPTRAGWATSSTRRARATPSSSAAAGSRCRATCSPRGRTRARPCSSSTPSWSSLARDELGLRESPRLRVRVGDARVRLREVPTDSADLVVGDAFGGRSIPWHLATREFVADMRRVLRPGGVYVANVIDHGDARPRCAPRRRRCARSSRTSG